MTYRFAIIGCRHGHIQSFIGDMLARGHLCAGIYDPEDQKLVRQYAERYGIPIAGSADELLDRSVHIVGSSAVNNEKIDLIEACEARGIHVMLDKPAVTDRNGLERLEAVAARGTIRIGMMLPKRFWGWMTALKREIDAGTLGRLVNVYVSSPHKLVPASRDDWHFSKKRNGGVLIDLLIHDMDLLRFLTGKDILATQSVIGKSILPEYPDFYDSASVQVVLEDGITAQLYADWHTPANNKDGRFSRLIVAGTEGYAEWGVGYDAQSGQWAKRLVITRGVAPDQAGCELEPDDAAATAISDFLDRVEGKPGQFTHRDLTAASRAAIEADEQAIILNRYGGASS